MHIAEFNKDFHMIREICSLKAGISRSYNKGNSYCYKEIKLRSRAMDMMSVSNSKYCPF